MTVRIVCCGMNSKKVVQIAEEAGDERIVARTMSDMAGAQAVQSGQYDFYIGTCNTGGGGSLGIATGILGHRRVKTVGTAGRIPNYEEILKEVGNGVKAFGLIYSQADRIVPLIVRAVLQAENDEEGSP